MIVALAIIIICCAGALFAQYRAQRHELELLGSASRIRGLADRIAILEAHKIAEFDSTAFDDLKTKVEALRFAQGLRSVR
jgi:hypothetical protein